MGVHSESIDLSAAVACNVVTLVWSSTSGYILQRVTQSAAIWFHWKRHTFVTSVCVCVNKYEYKIALGAVAPAVLGCWLVSWQSSGSHGNEEQDAPSLDLWCSLPPGELHEDRGQNQ